MKAKEQQAKIQADGRGEKQCPVCDGSGGIPHKVLVPQFGTDEFGDQIEIEPAEDWELEQCQWCDENPDRIIEIKGQEMVGYQDKEGRRKWLNKYPNQERAVTYLNKIGYTIPIYTYLVGSIVNVREIEKPDNLDYMPTTFEGLHWDFSNGYVVKRPATEKRDAGRKRYLKALKEYNENPKWEVI